MDTEKTRENCGNWDANMHTCLAVKQEAACDPRDPRFNPADCPFWMAEQEIQARREAALRRIAKLPEAQKRHYALNYYGGAQPWKKYE